MAKSATEIHFTSNPLRTFETIFRPEVFVMNQHIRIATHRSPLALMYADKVASEIRRLHPDISIELIKVVTKGDQFYFEPLPELGGKCLFTSEVDQALLDGRADIAVHVIEERARTNAGWPRGWLCTASHLYGDNNFYFITDLRKIPELLFSSPRSRSG